MRELRKALALSPSDWMLIAQARVGLVAVEAGLRCLSLPTVLRLLQGGRRSPREVPDALLPQRLAYCVSLAARLCVLRPTCLKKSLVLSALLLRRGFKARVLIGAARIGDQLDSHAWVECQGEILMGEPAPGRYLPLCELTGSTVSAQQPLVQAMP